MKQEFNKSVVINHHINLRRGWLIVAAFAALVAGEVSVGARSAHAGWGEDALIREANYIADCSFSRYCTWYATHPNDAGGFNTSSAAYGALNDIRVNQQGADFVRPGESAMGAVGLIQAVRQLRALNGSGTYNAQITRYDNVLGAFFRTYVLKRTTDAGGNHFQILQDGSNAVYSQIYYNTDGSWRQNDAPNIGVTAQMMIALWKYCDYQESLGITNFRNDPVTWDFMTRAASYLTWSGRYNATYDLVSNDAGGWMWTADNALAVAALQCAAKWAQTKGLGTSVYQPWLNRAANIQKGLLALKDTGGWKGFYRVRKSDGTASYDAGDGNGRVVDQLCFAPYETNALSTIPGFAYPSGGSADYPNPTQLQDWNFANAISDFWTVGDGASGFPAMTDSRNDWRFYGTKWHYYYDNPGRTENHQLYPGPGLQLAKVEWKCANARGQDTDTYRNTAGTVAYRANRRFRWANTGDATGGNLWYGGGSWNPFTGVWTAGQWTYGVSFPSEGDHGISNGIIDWRDADNYNRAADEWNRFIDTSAYFIEVTLMNIWRQDTRYTP
ncbi:MAG: hypothetical protein H8F28_13725 [Fibrella sp.]|nr:hypothetical protein [Armatimonadota bacterium]